jgi:hypothetical protein
VERMERAFAIVLFVVVGVAVVGAVVSLVMSGDAWSRVGRGGMSIGEDRPLGGRSVPAGLRGGALTPAQAAEREADIRSMLEARAARRVARGEDAGDVEAELAELLRPGGAGGAGGVDGAGAVDAELEAEVRMLVESRNAGRVERGEAPLDVEAEVARRLREYGA